MSKPPSRNNSKRIARPQGGGNAKQGLAPLATQFFISQANNVQYRTGSGDGRNRDLVICVNQLGGIGKGRSQFRANADGKRGAGCDDFETFKTYLLEINSYIQNIALPRAFNSNNVFNTDINGSNNKANYKLCFVGNQESVLTDLKTTMHNNSFQSTFESFRMQIVNSSSDGVTVNNPVFTHLLSHPEQIVFGDSQLSNPTRFSYYSGDNPLTSNLLHSSINININNIQNKINFCNNYFQRIIRPDLNTHSNLNKYGYHTLGLINSNIEFTQNEFEGKITITQLLNYGGYGTTSVFGLNSPIQNNAVNIYASSENSFVIENFIFSNTFLINDESVIVHYGVAGEGNDNFNPNPKTLGLFSDPPLYNTLLLDSSLNINVNTAPNKHIPPFLPQLTPHSYPTYKNDSSYVFANFIQGSSYPDLTNIDSYSDLSSSQEIYADISNNIEKIIRVSINEKTYYYINSIDTNSKLTDVSIIILIYEIDQSSDGKNIAEAANLGYTSSTHELLNLRGQRIGMNFFSPSASSINL